MFSELGSTHKVKGLSKEISARFGGLLFFKVLLRHGCSMIYTTPSIICHLPSLFQDHSFVRTIQTKKL
jgi:hypothetical protein